MNRRFGIELEIADVTQAKAAAALRAVGLNVSTPGYTHQTSTTWKIVSDSSVRNGFEVVSPILQGQAGLDAASSAINALKAAGARANVSCGFHVHFDAAGLGVEDVRSIVSRYAAFESQIDAFMPQSRRANQNMYCKSVCDFATTQRFQTARTVSELASVQMSRYYKVNLQSLHRHGTIEFRQHNGMVDADRALLWITMLDEFISESIRLAHQEPAQGEVRNNVQTTLTATQERIVRMIQNGTRNAMLLGEMLRMQPHSLRAAISRIRQTGLTIRSTRHEGTTFYEIDPEQNIESTGTLTRNTADMLWSGIDAATATFYRQRAAVLAIA